MRVSVAGVGMRLLALPGGTSSSNDISIALPPALSLQLTHRRLQTGEHVLLLLLLARRSHLKADLLASTVLNINALLLQSIYFYKTILFAL